MDTTTDRFSYVRRLMTNATGDEKHDESSTSTLDALWVLYDRVLRVDPADPRAEDRDRFILSKGHGPVALYAILAAKGFFPEAWLCDFMDEGGRLGSHPDRSLVPGVEASTGSLGHGLPMAVGVAQALLAKGNASARVVVLCGDAELNEGSNWEAITIASHLGLDNLTLLVVDNHSSAYAPGSWTERLGSFGWIVREVDGHDHDALEAAFRSPHPSPQHAPLAVVAAVPAGEW